MIVLTTPTGDIGSQILTRLVDSKEEIRVIVRETSKLPADVRDLVEVIAGSHGDASVLDKALAGADSLFWLLPPDMSLDSLDAAYVGFTRPLPGAIQKSGLKRVVTVSALGRGWKKEAGHVTSSSKMEDLIASTGVSMRVLTMPSFMENLLRQAQTIKEKGMFFSPIDGDKKLPTVATSDIAAVAADFLLDHSWTAQVDVPVLGPEDLSHNEMASILTDVLGKPVQFQQITMEAFKSRMAGYGMSEAFAQGYVEMMTAKNEGIDNTADRKQAAPSPTTFRQWSETVLKPEVQRAKASSA